MKKKKKKDFRFGNMKQASGIAFRPFFYPSIFISSPPSLQSSKIVTQYCSSGGSKEFR
jgi:hypothetical protein